VSRLARATRAALAGCLSALSVAGGLAGCTNAETARPTSRLVIALPQEPESLNPLLMSGAATATLVPMIYSLLLTLDERGRLVPDLATSVPTVANGGVSRDGKTIVYHLRSSATWQDGQPITSADVVFTYDAIVNPRNNVVSRAGYDEIASVDALDRDTVRVRLRRPYAPILSIFLAPNQNYGLLPAHLLRGKADLNRVSYNGDPVGSGPYRVASWVRGDHLSLVRNASYYGGAPAIEALEIKFVTDSNTILNQLRTGEVNVSLVADPNQLAAYASIPQTRVVRAPLAGVGDLFFNLRDANLGDVRVRRALVEAVDLPTIVRKATKGAQTFADAGRGLYGWGYDPNAPLPAYDPRSAARLLDAAGWRRSPGGVRSKDGRSLSLQFAYVLGNAAASSIGLLLQDQLRAGGVDLQLRGYNPTQFRAPASSGGPIFGGKYQIGFLEIYTQSDPDTEWYLGCSQIPPHGFNISAYCDAQTERAEAAGTATYDPAQRRRFASAVQRRIAQELPSIPLWQQNAVYVVPSVLRGFRPSLQSATWNVASWTIGS
jgi:peptide/nickel transport system substrate-binding protein